MYGADACIDLACGLSIEVAENRLVDCLLAGERCDEP